MINIISYILYFIVIQFMKFIYWINCKKKIYVKQKYNNDIKNIAINTILEGNGHIQRTITLVDYFEKNDDKYKIKVIYLLNKGNLNKIPNYFIDRIKKYKLIYLDGYYFKTENYSIDKLGTIINGINYVINHFADNCNIMNNEINLNKIDLLIDTFDPSFPIYYSIANSITPVVFFINSSRIIHSNIKLNINFIEKVLLTVIYNFFKYTKNSKINIISPLPFLNYKNVIPLYNINSIEEYNTITSNIILCYFYNKNYLHFLKKYSINYPDFHFMCFINEKPNINKYNNITILKSDYKKFNLYLDTCLGVICSSGFNTPIEAIFKKKPVLGIPTHFEQMNVSNIYSTLYSGYFYINKLPDKNYEDLFINKLDEFMFYIKYKPKNNFYQECDKTIEFRKLFDEKMFNILNG